MDRAFADAALPVDDVCEAVRREQLGDIMGDGFADGPDLDAIGGLSRNRKYAHHRRGGEA
jgi:hypothetical protein